jgi:hypothetical protein
MLQHAESCIQHPNKCHCIACATPSNFAHLVTWQKHTENGKEIGRIDHDGAEMDILIRAAAPGGTSKYLPDVYKELYQSNLQ